jgi:hypothetical protein
MARSRFPFYDHAKWEQIKRQGNAAIQRWIDSELKGSSVTVVLIGPETLSRRWVRYEIDQSIRVGKGLLGVTLEGMRQRDGRADMWNEYAAYGPFVDGRRTHPVYSWVDDNGRQNLSHWVEEAAQRARR